MPRPQWGVTGKQRAMLTPGMLAGEKVSLEALFFSPAGQPMFSWKLKPHDNQQQDYT